MRQFPHSRDFAKSRACERSALKRYSPNADNCGKSQSVTSSSARGVQPITLRPPTATTSLQASARLLAAALVLAALALAPFTSRADAGASDFPATLYLGGTAASVSGSHQLLTSGGPGAPSAAPVVAAQAGGTMATGAWAYALAYVGAGGETPLGPTASLNLVAGSQQVNVTAGAAPAGVTTIRVYRQRGMSPYHHVADIAAVGGTVLDNATEPAAPNGPWSQSPHAQTRLPIGVGGVCNATNCGYTEFSPASPLATTVANSTPTATASTTPSNKGWMVDVAGPVAFAAGNWTFQVQSRSGVSANGVARLAVGMWKVTVSGGAVASSTLLVDPNGAGEQTTTNLIDTTNAAKTVTHTVNLSSFSLANGEYLYVQFWRRQTSAYSGGSAIARTVTLYAYDGIGSIQHPAADDAAPSAFSITAPASGGAVRNGSVLQSNPSDPSPGSGLASVEYFYCLPLADCSFAPNRVSIGSALASPWSVTWNGQPADGGYQLVARATDNVGNVTDTAVIPVTVDNTAPDTSFSSTPSNPSNGSPSFGLASNESATFECSLDGGGYAPCTTPYSPTLASGAHTLAVRGLDAAGNVDATPVSFAWNVDATAPVVTLTSTPPNPSGSASASFAFTTTEGTLTCRLDGAAFTACSSPRALSGLADGSHTFDVRATDSVGNVGNATYTWTIDTTPPTTTFSSTPPSISAASGAVFAFAASEVATLECRVDGAAFAPCASPQSVAGLAEGSHTFEVRATDALGHVGSRTYTWRVDTVAPRAPSLDNPVGGIARKVPRLTTVNLDSDQVTLEFRLCADAACASILSVGAAEGTHGLGAAATWVPPVALADGTYHWQARATDAAGNVSAWAPTASFVRDTVAPATPGAFGGSVGSDGLTLRWSQPTGAADVANYVVYVDGKIFRTLGARTFEVKLGAFDAGDTRTFQVSAIDVADNESDHTTRLVGVPNLLGLGVPAARDAVETRGLRLGEPRVTAGLSGSATRIVSQTPPAPALAAWGSVVEVILGNADVPTVQPLVRIAQSKVCGRNGVLRLQVRLQTRAASARSPPASPPRSSGSRRRSASRAATASRSRRRPARARRRRSRT